MFDQAVNSLPHVRGGKIKAYAVTANTHLASALEIPTVDEAGLPGFYISIWSGMWAPKGTPKDVVVKLNAAVVGALAHPTVRQQLADLGQEVPTNRPLKRSALFKGPRWRSGGRSSRRRTSKRNEASRLRAFQRATL
jgi:tripartite-type tricarboxylate transporter receptor subunit TctC